ncbi:hypothetical protein [Cumulibacter manganitolerans]|uniref:hypothetical protein n=1 Tax=Cumulibacter manganitolerans TaxID=1884992 RepID=UPI0012961598|nr:hypothetical protein [Cumulibacter manganitolerans]
MTGPGEPGQGDPSDTDSARERLGRHAAPDDEETAPAAPSDSSSRRGRHAGPPSGDLPAQPDGESGPGSAADVRPADPTLGADVPVDGVPVAGSTPLDGDPPADGVPLAGSDPVPGDAPGDAQRDDEASAAPAERRRHAATGSSFRVPGWMIAVAGVVVLGLIIWLVVALASGGDEPKGGSAASSSAAATASTSAKPTPVNAESLPQVLCMGSSYVMVQTGESTEQLLADPKAAEAKFPGSKLSTIPAGCVANSDVRDEVVLALGPYTSIQEACAAGKTLQQQGVQFKAYAGSADAGLTETSCP